MELIPAVALRLMLVLSGGTIAHAAADPVITVRDGRLVMPDSIASGWRRIRVEEDGAGHIVVAFRMRDASGPVEMGRFLADLDATDMTPPAALAIGGPEIGDTGEVILQLTPGRYVFTCVRRGADGHRHGRSGEARIVTVVGRAGLGTPPRVADTVRMAEFAYITAERWQPGPRILRVENIGQQDHQLRINRLREGATAREWLVAEDPAAYAKPIAGVARMGPGAAAYLPVDLPPGNYVIYCLVTDPASKQPHVMRGMVKPIRVEQPPRGRRQGRR